MTHAKPELVALVECLEDHEDDINLLYLTDSEVILQSIHRWIGCGSKLNLSKSPDTDVLKKIILKLQKRVHAGVGDSPTNRTVYQWTVGPTTRSSTWTNTVRNRFRQKTGEIEAFRALEIKTKSFMGVS